MKGLDQSLTGFGFGDEVRRGVGIPGRGGIAQIVQSRPDLLHGDGFGQEIAGADLNRLDRGLDRTVGGQDDALDGGTKLPGGSQNRHAIDRLHTKVRQHDVRWVLGQGSNGVLAAVNGRHVVAELAQNHGQAIRRGAVVVDH